MRIGIDLGGTKTEIICLHQQNGKELYRQRVPTPQNDYEATVRSIKELVERAEDTLGETGTVGIGTPGSISDATGVIKNSNSVWVNGKPLDKDLEAALGREVRVQNDANCFAVSEATDGAAAGKAVVFGVIIGTGCGGGVVINGKPIRGVNGIGGEWGHNPLPYPKSYRRDPAQSIELFKSHNAQITEDDGAISYFVDEEILNEWPGPLCYCGKRGCQETWISGPGFKNDYIRVTGQELSTHDIIAAMNQGEEQAVAAFARYVDRLARALSVVINLIDPDVVVLGGGMSNVSQLYQDVPAVWDRYIFSDTIDTKLVPPRFGDSSGVRGAAWLWNDESLPLA